MTVWIINPFDNLPQEGYRPQRYWLMSRAFAQAGHDVVYWTSDFSHAHKRQRKCSNGKMGPWEGEGFRLVLVPTPGYRRNICLKRIWSHRVFAKRWRTLAELEAKKPDVVIASLPPLASGAQALEFCRKHGAKFVADIQDAWPETFYRVLPKFLFAPLRRVAREIYRGADAVSGVAQRYLDLASSYGSTAPRRLVPLGIDQSANRPIDQSTNRTILRLLYAGNMGASYDLATVVTGVKEMEGVTLDLAGTGPKEPMLRALAEGCDRIRFHGYLDEKGLRDFLAQGDVALVPMFDASCVGVPGKMGDYTAAGLPVLNSLAGETESLLAEYGAGFTYKAGDVGAFRAAVDKARSLDDEGWSRLRAGAAKLAHRFDASVIFPAYVSWVESVAKGG